MSIEQVEDSELDILHVRTIYLDAPKDALSMEETVRALCAEAAQTLIDAYSKIEADTVTNNGEVPDDTPDILAVATEVINDSGARFLLRIAVSVTHCNDPDCPEHSTTASPHDPDCPLHPDNREKIH